MSTAFQHNAFQPNAFQIGAEPPDVTIDEISPSPAAAITTVIALSSWVFFAPPAAVAYVYDTPPPPPRAAKPAPRPSDDTFYRYANSQQSWIAAQDAPRPRLNPPLAPRPALDTFIPPVAAAVYPAGLDPMPRPKYTAPEPSTRLDQMGTVGVFFYMPQYDFGWADNARPRYRIPQSPKRDADAYIPVAVTATYDYGWTSTARPRLQWPQGPRRDSDPYMPAVVVGTYDYGWKDIPRLPTQLKPPNGRNIVQDLYARFTGGPADWSRFIEPQRPVPPRPTVGRVLGPDPFIITPGRTPDYGWFARPQLPLHPPLPLGARAYIDWFPWQVLNFLPPLNRTSTQVLYLPYTTENVLPYSTRLNGLPYETEEG